MEDLCLPVRLFRISLAESGERKNMERVLHEETAAQDVLLGRARRRRGLRLAVLLARPLESLLDFTALRPDRALLPHLVSPVLVVWWAAKGSVSPGSPAADRARAARVPLLAGADRPFLPYPAAPQVAGRRLVSGPGLWHLLRGCFYLQSLFG